MESEIGADILRKELDISTQIANLEAQTAHLEGDFESISASARELAHVVRRYVDKVETERKSWDVLEIMLESGLTARDVLDHVKIFFNFLLARMTSQHSDVTDVKMLWHHLDKEEVKQAFRRALKYFGFTDADERSINVLMAIMYKMQVDLERDTSSDQPAGSSISFEKCKDIISQCMSKSNHPSNQQTTLAIDASATKDETSANDVQTGFNDEKDDLTREKKAAAISREINTSAAKIIEAVDNKDKNKHFKDPNGGTDNANDAVAIGQELKVGDWNFVELSQDNIDIKILETITAWPLNDNLKEVLKPSLDKDFGNFMELSCREDGSITDVVPSTCYLQ